MKLYDAFRSSGCACQIVNTPREISASCGLSVKVQEKDAAHALELYEYYRPETLIGIFFCGSSGCTRYR